MTKVHIDIRNIASETHPDDRVVIYSVANRNADGTIISTAVKEVALVDGQSQVDLVPESAVAVRFECLGVADTTEKLGWVPAEGPVSLSDVILKWTPALIDQGILAILAAVENAIDEVGGAVAAEIGNTTHVISNGQTTHANKVVRLNDQGKLAIGSGTVTEGTDPASKGYVDSEVAEKANRTHKHNASDIVGDISSYVNFSTDNRFANHLVRLDGDGKLHVSTAGITIATDPVNKEYTDATAKAAADAVQEKIGSRLAWWN